MHFSYFSGYIYVEKISEQYYLGYHNSQKTREDVWWDMYSSNGSDVQQVEGEDDPKEGI